MAEDAGAVLTRAALFASALQRVAVGLARLDTSEAVALGAYAFALGALT